uniref:1,4-alpha-glucan branching enzyme n=1 Tax=Hemiselmis andersenii TaxID=464988 RepID=A0A6U4WMG1_HEMAN|mmetsp:Transcript_17773/g.41028  ORF Transcript_17773/g.41028 Transcript_17773/m.41028 type:complete len:783 (+) Transcript_17773:108-2456(+)
MMSQRRSFAAAGVASVCVLALISLPAAVALSHRTGRATPVLNGPLRSITRKAKLLKPDSTLRLRGGAAEMEAARDMTFKDASTLEYLDWYQKPDPQWEDKDGCGVVQWDPSLEAWKGSLQHRYGKYKELKRNICKVEGSLENFAKGNEKFGVRRSTDPNKPGIIATEWAPSAQYLALFGDFNGWNRGAHPYSKDDYGVWHLFIPDNADGTPVIPHESRYKIAITTSTGQETTRIPAWVTYTVQAPKGAPTHPGYDAVMWDPPQKFEFKSALPPQPKSLRIYEAHVGMSSEGEPNVNTYDLFRERVLPRIHRLGYNAIQLMAIQEHPYYASFGYHVTSLFAPSSRSGDPDSLKRLVDECHRLGMNVLLDVVHSHAAKNVEDGINNFDGTAHQYFHEGPEGYHTLWDSRIYNYSSWEVLRFLLSNLRWWLEEYKFDGFRFDGVTSILYTHHGMNHAFVHGYDDYFGTATDMDACVYLMLANDLIHSIRPGCISIAEDVSGMPTLSRPVSEGGFGFDYRLAMAAPDMWIKLLKEFTDDEWEMGYIVHTLTNRRYKEKVVCYCESHDQALVGDKTISFRLMDKEMYDGMSNLTPANLIVDRGIAMHKMIRMLTMSLGGEGYLNFMGNEFGHPEWIDFPRVGNDWSYHCARRQWSLADQTHLRYIHLNNFDAAMHGLEQTFPFLVEDCHEYVSLKNEGDKMIVAEKGELLFVFNMHPSNSYQGYRVGTSWGGKYKIVLDSDWPEFGGHYRNDRHQVLHAKNEQWCGRPHYLEIYSPSRTVMVFAKAQ